MTALATLLDDPTDLLRRLIVRAPEPAAIRKVNMTIAGQVGATPDPERTAELQSRVAAQIRANGVASVSRRDLRQSCLTFLHAPHPPIADPEIGPAIVSCVAEKQRRAAFFALIDCYLDSYQTADPSVGRLAELLQEMSTNWPWRLGDQWRRRLEAFDLLNETEAPKRLAQAVLTSANGPRPILEASGLDIGARPFGGLVEAAFRIASNDVGGLTGQRAEDAQTMLLRWAQHPPGTVSFPNSWIDLLCACLEPWVHREPQESHKVHLLEELQILGGGDPRISGSARWRQAAENAPMAYSVLLRWLTRASVMQFLEIVDRSLREPDARRMWAYRKAFWTSYLLNENGPRIDRAWVAFGADGARLARSVARETGDKALSVFGNQLEKSGQHAALILEIGDFRIVDWSHSGKYNVWNRGERGPRLFLPKYEPGELDSAPLRDSHVSPSTYSWQRKLAQIIEGRVFFSPKPDWRPKRV